MITVREVDKSKINVLVRISYRFDFQGFDKYHVRKFNYDQAVRETVKQIQDMEAQVPMRYFEVNYKGEAIGYFTCFDQCLYSFAIEKKYRTVRGLLTAYWNEIKKVLRGTFVCILYRNNTRAIAYLQKFGMEITGHSFEDKNLITLINR